MPSPRKYSKILVLCVVAYFIYMLFQYQILVNPLTYESNCDKPHSSNHSSTTSVAENITNLKNNQPSPHMAPASAEIDFRVFEHRSHNYTEEEVASAIRHANMFLYLVETENPFFICMPPKTGSTQFKALFAYINGGPNYLKSLGINIQPVHDDKDFIAYRLTELSQDLKEKHLKSSSRLLITRNPYERFLSGYFDFLSRNGNPKVSFPQFLFMAEKKVRKSAIYDLMPHHHYQSVSEVARFDQTYYSAYLRLEEQDLWYDSFVKAHKLEPFLSKLVKEGTPFYATSTKPNDTIYTKLEQSLGKSAWKGNNLNSDGHVNDSASKLFTYYTPQLAKRVYDLFRDDFENFGYPSWNGDPSNFHYL